MSNELSERLHIQPSLAVNQDGDKNVNINNQDGGTVNFNITYQPNNVDKIIELTGILQTLSRESYQLFVTRDDEVFKNNVVSVSASRIPTKYSIVKDDCRRYIQISENDIEELKLIPAIICLENTDYNGFTDPNQWAMFAYIKKIKVTDKYINFAFNPIAPIQQQKLCEGRNSIFFDLNMDCSVTSLNISGWTIHKTDIFEAFEEAKIPDIPMPRM